MEGILPAFHEYDYIVIVKVIPATPVLLVRYERRLNALNRTLRRRTMAAALSGLLFLVCAAVTALLLQADKIGAPISLFLTLTMSFGGLFAGHAAVLFVRTRSPKT
ncbi:hypothetical protein [Paenibacillus ginsengarvi]|nr:hypothetical protein [Paenibacillus ginsengarvi]